jgi:cytochrome bd ubiquinol oxidase subunit II
METLWFVLVAFMLTAYVVLDGFDLGAGLIGPFIADSYAERRLVLRTIGPVWSGNEVWLIAAAGALFFAFPRLYAASFSGFYLSLMIVLWLLMLRGMGAELRAHIHDPLWWSLCDFVFAAASLLLSLFYGVAIGNVLRGVPLSAEGYFFEPLWTDFSVGPESGILDWYTLLTGSVALAMFAAHGAHYVAVKTEGPVQARARRAAARAWAALVLLTTSAFVATLAIRPEILDRFFENPWGWAIPLVVAGALVAMPVYRRKGRDLAAFLASAVYIIAMMSAAAFAVYPALLPASTGPAYSLTIYNTHTGAYSMEVGLVWWLVGTALAVGYFVFLYRSFRGKVNLEDEGGEAPPPQAGQPSSGRG